jgi:hypothetical protein
MEIFSTLLQCRVDLSMFHLLSTSKIWHTSTYVHYHGAKPQNCVVEIFCTTSGQSLLSLLGTMEKNFSFHFKHYNLTIRLERFWRKTPLGPLGVKKHSEGILGVEQQNGKDWERD